VKHNFHTLKMEHLGLHAAAHVFFENKLDDLTSEFNGKMKKMQAFVQKELRKLHDIHMGEVKKLKHELRLLKDEVVDLRRLEDDITHTGMSQIRRLSKEVKEEVHDIRRIKGEVTHMKEEITDIKHHEEDMTHVGMHQMTKMNKEMKTEVKQLKSQIKTLKREVMDAKEGSSKEQEQESNDTVNTLKLTPQEIDELLAVRESVHNAFERSLKSTTECPDQDEEETNRPLNLWLPSTSPSAKSDDAIQLSRTVILYVKAVRDSPVSSHPSLQWSYHEEEDHCLDGSAPVTRNSSFDAAGARARIAQSKAGSQDTDEEEAHAHLPHAVHLHQDGHAPAGHLVSHVPHPAGNFYHSHLTSALREIRGDSIPALTPVLSEDEEAAVEEGSNGDSGLRMRIDKVAGGGDLSAATKSGQKVTEQTSDNEESLAMCVGEGCEPVKANNNNESQGHQEKKVSIKHRGSI